MPSHQQRTRHPSRPTHRVAPRVVPSRTLRPTRSVSQKPDYSQDYAYVRRDLKRIALWSSVLTIAMIVGYVLF